MRPSGADILTQDEEFDVANVFAVLRRRWWIILAITLISGFGLLVLFSFMDPRYESSSRILIRDGENAFTRATDDNTFNPSSARLDEQAIRSEVEVLNSNSLALDVVRQLGLADMPEFNDAGLLERLTGNVLGTALLSGSPAAQAANLPTDAENEALKAFQTRLEVYAVDQSRVIVVSFWSHDAALARQVVDTLGKLYIERNRRSSVINEENATVWLDPRIAELEVEVRNAEAAVSRFRANSDILRSSNSDALLATQQLSEISTELSRVKAERSSAQAKASAIKTALENGASVDVVPEVIDSELIQRLREREVALRAQISELSTILLPNHPRMKALNSQVADFEKQIRAAARNILQSLQNNVALARETEADLSREIDRLKAEAVRVDEKLVELRALEREAATRRALLEEYKSRSLEAKSRIGLSTADAEIISPASLALDPFFPKVLPYTIAGTMAVGVLTALLFLTFSLMGETARTIRQSDVDRREYEPMLESDYSMAEEGDEHETPLPEDEIATRTPNEQAVFEPKAFQRLQQKLADQTSATDLRSPGAVKIGGEIDGSVTVREGLAALAAIEASRVVFATPGSEKSAGAVWMLARMAAAGGLEVALIDLGGDAATLEMLGKLDLPGLFDLVEGRVDVSEVLFQDRAGKVHVMTGGQSLSPNGPDPKAISDMIDLVAQSYDLTIVDCGDADLEQLNIVADDDSIAVLSAMGEDTSELEHLARQLHADGYAGVMRIQPDAIDNRNANELAA